MVTFNKHYIGGDNMTENMKNFINSNRLNPVWYGKIVESKGILYKLDNGQNFLLSDEDTNSAPDFTPDWGF